MCFCAIFRNKCFEVENQLTKDYEEFDEAPDVVLDIFPEKGVLLEGRHQKKNRFFFRKKS